MTKVSQPAPYQKSQFLAVWTPCHGWAYHVRTLFSIEQLPKTVGRIKSGKTHVDESDERYIGGGSSVSVDVTDRVSRPMQQAHRRKRWCQYLAMPLCFVVVLLTRGINPIFFLFCFILFCFFLFFFFFKFH